MWQDGAGPVLISQLHSHDTGSTGRSQLLLAARLPACRNSPSGIVQLLLFNASHSHGKSNNRQADRLREKLTTQPAAAAVAIATATAAAAGASTASIASS